jgi:hypothetical protein
MDGLPCPVIEGKGRQAGLRHLACGIELPKGPFLSPLCRHITFQRGLSYGLFPVALLLPVLRLYPSMAGEVIPPPYVITANDKRGLIVVTGASVLAFVWCCSLIRVWLRWRLKEWRSDGEFCRFLFFVLFFFPFCNSTPIPVIGIQ